MLVISLLRWTKSILLENNGSYWKSRGKFWWEKEYFIVVDSREPKLLGL